MSRAESKGECLGQVQKESWGRVLRTAAGVSPGLVYREQASFTVPKLSLVFLNWR